MTTAFSRYRPLIDDWEAFLASSKAPLPGSIWTNTLRMMPSALQALMIDDHPEPLAWYPGAFSFSPETELGNRLPYLAGCYHIQEAVSLLPVLLMAPKPGMRVLDLCAAPGNKTAQMAVMMGNRGTVVANDLHTMRANILRMTIDRLGLLNVTLTTTDAVRYPDADASYDAVLADVPCSCEGTTRKHPRVAHLTSPENSLRLQTLQRRILERALALCRPGGKVVYATCTYAPEENEAVVAGVLEESGSVELCPVTVPGFRFAPGLTRWNDLTFPDALRHCVRIWPHHNDTGGFFIAVLRKKG